MAKRRKAISSSSPQIPMMANAKSDWKRRKSQLRMAESGDVDQDGAHGIARVAQR